MLEIAECFVTVLVIATTVFVLHGFYKNQQEKGHLKRLRKKKQLQRQRQFEELKSIHITYNEGIDKLSFKELREALQRRELTCEEVLKSTIAKSLEVQEAFNCITEFAPDVVEKYKHLDSLPSPSGPLFGIPFCVKDDTDLEGVDTTTGFSRNLDNAAKSSAVLVRVLESLGGVPYCKTNLPQGCLSIGSDNPIFGQTLNPLNRKLGPGGSSSGTASLVAAGGCHFGIGSDSGGSLRIPAQCCGLSTLKATFNRLSDMGCLHCSPNLTTVPGFLMKNADDLAFIYELVIEAHNKNPLDYRVPRIPWNDTESRAATPLRIGYYTTLACMPAVGDIPLTVTRAVSYLESKGHTLVPFEVPNVERLWIAMLFDPTMQTMFLRNIKNDEVGNCVKDLCTAFSLMPLLYYSHKAYHAIGSLLNWENSIKDFPLLAQVEKESVGYQILEQMKDLDLILCPVFPFVAVDKDKMAEISMKMQYSLLYPYLWNLINFPAGVVKFGKETGENWPRNDSLFGKLKEDCIDMPIGVQVVGKPYKEEMVLRVMKELDIMD